MELYKSVLANYLGESAFIGVALICLLIIMLDKKARKNIGWPSLFVLLFLVNPISIMVAMRLLSDVNRITKLLIVFPAHILIAYVITEYCESMKKKLVAIVLILAIGSGIYLDGDFQLTKNKYKLPESVIEVCDAIREQQGNDEEVLVLANVPINYYLRLYDENIMLEAGRYEVGYNEYAQLLQSIIEEYQVDTEQLGSLAKEAGIDYIVISDSKMVSSMETHGYTYVKKVSGYKIFVREGEE